MLVRDHNPQKRRLTAVVALLRRTSQALPWSRRTERFVVTIKIAILLLFVAVGLTGIWPRPSPTNWEPTGLADRRRHDHFSWCTRVLSSSPTPPNTSRTRAAHSPRPTTSARRLLFGA